MKNSVIYDYILAVAIMFCITVLLLVVITWGNGDKRQEAEECVARGGQWTEISHDRFGCLGVSG